MLSRNRIEYNSDSRTWCRCSQELAERAFPVVVPDHGHDLGRVDHGPSGLADQADHAVLEDLHAGQLLVVIGGESDLAAAADDHEDRAGLADEGPEQVADHLAGHGPSPPDQGRGQAANRARSSAMPAGPRPNEVNTPSPHWSSRSAASAKSRSVRPGSSRRAKPMTCFTV